MSELCCKKKNLQSSVSSNGSGIVETGYLSSTFTNQQHFGDSTTVFRWITVEPSMEPAVD